MGDGPSIEDVKRRHGPSLLARPGVSAVAVEHTPDGAPVLTVYVESDEHAQQLQLPPALEGYPVRVATSGRFKAL
jgi:hypothetical protein